MKDLFNDDFYDEDWEQREFTDDDYVGCENESVDYDISQIYESENYFKNENVNDDEFSCYGVYFKDGSYKALALNFNNAKRIGENKDVMYKKFSDINIAKEWLKTKMFYDTPRALQTYKKNTYEEKQIEKLSEDKKNNSLHAHCEYTNSDKVECLVVDYNGVNLLPKALNGSELNSNGYYQLDDGKKKYFGDMLATYFALKIAKSDSDIKLIYSTNENVVNIWSKGRYGKSLNEEGIKLVEELSKLAKEFNDNGGYIVFEVNNKARQILRKK